MRVKDIMDKAKSFSGYNWQGQILLRISWTRLDPVKDIMDKARSC